MNIFDADFARDPWPVLRSLRATGGVHRVSTPDGPPAWLLTGYDDVRAGLLDDRLSTAVRHANGRDYRGFSVPAPLDRFQAAEPDEHARLRRVLVGELQARRLTEWPERASALVDPLLRTVEGEREFDLVERIAIPLPAAIVTELLGLPAAEGAALLGWAESTLRPGAAPRARDTLATMRQIITATIDRGGRGADTVLGRLVRPQEESGAVDSDELASLLFYLLFVFYEVLVDLIAGAVWALADRPDRLSALEIAPERSVDELLRYLSPQVLAGPRFATADIEIGDHTIAAGQTVLLCLASANHDPATFRDPEELDLRRDPNPQLGLGFGVHACVGTAVARPVAAAVLTRIHARWPALRIAGDAGDLPWRSGFRHRGPLTLPVRT
nr:cytochrome P450 [Nocardia transvalensis]